MRVAVTVFEFGEYRLDSDRFELSRGGRELKLERKPLELLIFLAGSDGRLVTRVEIAERLWGSEVFVDTEHGINTAIRKIRQALGDDPEQPRFLQTVTGKGYRFIGSVAAQASEDSSMQPVEASVAVAQFLPQAPLVPDLPVAALATAPRPRRLLWLGVMGALAAILSLALVIRSVVNNSAHARSFAGVPPPIPRITSLAVLPLDNLSGEPGQDYLADGMTDELITMLAKNSTLRVISRTSVMQYKGVHRPLPEIAQELGVDGILEGSIARSGDKVHLNIQLIQAPTDTHVWADSYDRDANDMVSLPREAAQTIAKKLNSSILASAPPKFVNAEAHDAYVHGMYLWYRGQYSECYPYFKKATEIQPDYALGWTGLSNYYGGIIDNGSALPQDYRMLQKTSAIKAIQLDDSLPWAHLAMSGAYLYDDWDWANAEREIQRTMALDPELADGHLFHANLLLVLNRPQEAVAEQKRAIAMDPFSRPWAMALIYNIAGQYDDAIADAKARLVSIPNDVALTSMIADSYLYKGMYKESIEMREQAIEDGHDLAGAARMRRLYRQGGFKAVLLDQIALDKKQAAAHYRSPYQMAVPYGLLGRREETLRLLEESYRQHEGGISWIQTEPAFDFLHADQRYQAIVRAMKLPPAY